MVKSLALGGGGAERVLADVTDGLVRRGHEVIVASFDQAGLVPFYPFSPRLELVPLGIGKADKRSSIGEVLHRTRAIRRLALERRPDVAIGFMHSAFVPLAFALVGTGIPSVGSEHIVYDFYYDRPVDRLMVNLAARGLTALTAISPAMRDGFPRAAGRKMCVIPNPVQIHSGGLADTRGGKIKTILTVGRLEDQKDHASLISAFAAISPAFPDWRLRIVGEGSLRGALQRQVEALQLSDLVELKEPVSDIGREYATAQIFAMSSRFESFGLATAEALSNGLPVVGFADCPGTNELVVDGVNGLLVDGTARVESLSKGLARLMESPELRARLRRAGPQSIEKFSVESVVALWEDLMRRMSGQCAA